MMERILLGMMWVLIVFGNLAGPIGGVWLAIRGEWWAIGYALVAVIGAHFLLGVALLPAMLLGAPAAAVLGRRPRLGAVLGLPSLGYTAAIMTVWCMGVLTFFVSRANDANWIPILLVSFSVSASPWTYMAQQEIKAGSGDGASLATFFMQLALVVALVLLAMDRSRPPAHLWIAFALIMCAYVVVAMWNASKIRHLS